MRNPRVGGAFNTQVALGLLGGQHSLLCCFYRGEDGCLAARVLVDADAEIDFIGVGVALKCCTESQDRVGWSHIQLFEHCGTFLRALPVVGFE